MGHWDEAAAVFQCALDGAGGRGRSVFEEGAFRDFGFLKVPHCGIFVEQSFEPLFPHVLVEFPTARNANTGETSGAAGGAAGAAALDPMLSCLPDAMQHELARLHGEGVSEVRLFAALHDLPSVCATPSTTAVGDGEGPSVASKDLVDSSRVVYLLAQPWALRDDEGAGDEVVDIEMGAFGLRGARPMTASADGSSIPVGRLDGRRVGIQQGTFFPTNAGLHLDAPSASGAPVHTFFAIVRHGERCAIVFNAIAGTAEASAQLLRAARSSTTIDGLVATLAGSTQPAVEQPSWHRRAPFAATALSIRSMVYAAGLRARVATRQSLPTVVKKLSPPEEVPRGVSLPEPRRKKRPAGTRSDTTPPKQVNAARSRGRAAGRTGTVQPATASPASVAAAKSFRERRASRSKEPNRAADGIPVWNPRTPKKPSAAKRPSSARSGSRSTRRSARKPGHVAKVVKVDLSPDSRPGVPRKHSVAPPPAPVPAERSLAAAINEAEAGLSQREREIEKREAEVRASAAEVVKKWDAVQTDLREARETRNEIDEKLAQLEATSSAAADANKLKGELHTARLELQHIREQLARKDEAVKDARAAAEASAERNEAATGEAAKAGEALKAANARAAAAEQRAESLQRAIAKSDDHRVEVALSVASMKEDRKQFDEECAAILAKLELREAKLAAKTEELRQRQLSLQDRAEAHSKDQASGSGVSEKSSSRPQFDRDVQTDGDLPSLLEAEAAGLAEHKSALEEKERDLASRIAAVEEHERGVAATEASVSIMNDAVAARESDVAHREAELQAAEDELAKQEEVLDARSAEIEAAEARLAEARAAAASEKVIEEESFLQRQREELEKALSEATKAQAAITEERSEISKRAGELSAAEDQLAKRAADVAEREAAIARQELEHARAANKAAEELEAQRERMRVAANELEEQRAALLKQGAEERERSQGLAKKHANDAKELALRIDACGQRERELSEQAEAYVQVQKDVSAREEEVLNSIKKVSERERKVLSKEQALERRAQQLQQREQAIESRESQWANEEKKRREAARNAARSLRSDVDRATAAVESRETAVAERERAVAEREAAAAATVAEKERGLVKRERAVESREKDLAKKGESLQRREAEIASRQSELAAAETAHAEQVVDAEQRHADVMESVEQNATKVRSELRKLEEHLKTREAQVAAGSAAVEAASAAAKKAAAEAARKVAEADAKVAAAERAATEAAKRREAAERLVAAAESRHAELAEREKKLEETTPDVAEMKRRARRLKQRAKMLEAREKLVARHEAREKAAKEGNSGAVSPVAESSVGSPGSSPGDDTFADGFDQATRDDNASAAATARFFSPVAGDTEASDSIVRQATPIMQRLRQRSEAEGTPLDSDVQALLALLETRADAARPASTPVPQTHFSFSSSMGPYRDARHSRFREDAAATPRAPFAATQDSRPSPPEREDSNPRASEGTPESDMAVSVSPASTGAASSEERKRDGRPQQRLPAQRLCNFCCGAGHVEISSTRDAAGAEQQVAACPLLLRTDWSNLRYEVALQNDAGQALPAAWVGWMTENLRIGVDVSLLLAILSGSGFRPASVIEMCGAQAQQRESGETKAAAKHGSRDATSHGQRRSQSSGIRKRASVREVRLLE